jgi:hypothetical protein
MSIVEIETSRVECRFAEGPILITDFDYEEFVERSGLELPLYDEPGLGDCHGAILRLSSGRHVFAKFLKFAPLPRMYFEWNPAEDNVALIGGIVAWLGLRDDEILWRQGDGWEADWELTRQDDHGNCFTVLTSVDRVTAALEKRRLERAIHKQTYSLGRSDAGLPAS